MTKEEGIKFFADLGFVNLDGEHLDEACAYACSLPESFSRVLEARHAVQGLDSEFLALFDGDAEEGREILLKNPRFKELVDAPLISLLERLTLRQILEIVK